MPGLTRQQQRSGIAPHSPGKRTRKKDKKGFWRYSMLVNEWNAYDTDENDSADDTQECRCQGNKLCSV